jgi:hypothetical protein
VDGEDVKEFAYLLGHPSLIHERLVLLGGVVSVLGFGTLTCRTKRLRAGLRDHRQLEPQ